METMQTRMTNGSFECQGQFVEIWIPELKIGLSCEPQLQLSPKF